MDICRQAELAGSLWNRRPYASAAESDGKDAWYGPAYDYAGDHAYHRECGIADALYPYKHAWGAEFGLYPDSPGQGASGEQGDQPPCLP